MFKQIAESVANYLNIRPEDGEVPPVAATIEAPLENRSMKAATARSQ